MWNLKNIPKTLYVYWGGGKLPYLRYLTLSTFHYYNPDWDIALCRATEPQNGMTWTTNEQKYGNNYTDYYDKITSLGVIIRDMNFESLGFSNSASEVHKSDFIRWKLLSTFGGLWADMDILFTKPMDKLYFNTVENAEINTVFCISGYGHSIGFLMSSENNPYFAKVRDASTNEYVKEKYQCMGSLLCNKIFPTVESAKIEGVIPHNLSMDAVYAYDANHVDSIFSRNIPPLPQNAIGLHWYAGGKQAGAYLNATDGGAHIGNCLIGKLTKEYEDKSRSCVL